MRIGAWLLIGLLPQVSLAGLWQVCGSSPPEKSSEAVPSEEERHALPDGEPSIVVLQAHSCPHHAVEARLDPAYLHKTSPDPDRRIVQTQVGTAWFDASPPQTVREAQEAIPRAPPDLSQVLTSLHSVKLQI